MSNTTNPTVVVIGASYAGLHAAELLAQKLPQNWSVTLIERNTHFNHVYSFPRSAVIGQSHWNFIPYSGKINKLNLSSTQDSLNQQFNNSLSLSSSSSSSSSSSPSRRSTPSQRIQFINATVTKIVQGKVFLDRLVNLENNSLPSSTHELSTSSCSSTRSNTPDLSTSFMTDSGYGSLSPSRSTDKAASPRPIDSINQKSPDPNNIEHIDLPTSDPSPPRSFQIGWDFLVYALGSHMPAPLQLPHDLPRTKQSGVAFLEAQQAAIADAESIVIVGGGALGIQYACDIAHRYQLLDRPKKVTLIHSRSTFLPLFQPEMDVKIKQALKSYGVKVVLGERVNLTKLKKDIEEQKIKKIKTIKVESVSIDKKTWEADLVLICTAQVPNSSLMAKFCPLAVAGGMKYGGSTGLIRVNRALQISPSALGPSPIETPTGEASIACDCGLTSLKEFPIHNKKEQDLNLINPIWSRVFAIGDCIDGFGAIKAGHVGWNQAEIAAKNIIKLIHLTQSKGLDIHQASQIPQSLLESYVPSPPMIKLTLGLDRVVSQLTTKEDENKVEITEKIIPFSLVNDNDNDNSIFRSMWNRYDVLEHDVLDGWA